MSGKIGRLIGERREEQLLDLLSQFSHSWVDTIRRSTREEDILGIDIVVQTKDVGNLYVQVKSSQNDARRFRKKHKQRDPEKYPAVAVVVFHDAKSTFSVELCLSKIKQMRRDLIHHGKLLSMVY